MAALATTELDLKVFLPIALVVFQVTQKVTAEIVGVVQSSQGGTDELIGQLLSVERAFTDAQGDPVDFGALIKQLDLVQQDTTSRVRELVLDAKNEAERFRFASTFEGIPAEERRIPAILRLVEEVRPPK